MIHGSGRAASGLLISSRVAPNESGQSRNCSELLRTLCELLLSQTEAFGPRALCGDPAGPRSRLNRQDETRQIKVIPSGMGGGGEEQGESPRAVMGEAASAEVYIRVAEKTR